MKRERWRESGYRSRAARHVPRSIPPASQPANPPGICTGIILQERITLSGAIGANRAMNEPFAKRSCAPIFVAIEGGEGGRAFAEKFSPLESKCRNRYQDFDTRRYRRFLREHLAIKSVNVIYICIISYTSYTSLYRCITYNSRDCTNLAWFHKRKI